MPYDLSATCLLHSFDAVDWTTVRASGMQITLKFSNFKDLLLGHMNHFIKTSSL